MTSSHSHSPAMLGSRKLAVASTLSRHGKLSRSIFLCFHSSYGMRILRHKYLCCRFPRGFLRAKWDNTSEVLKHYANVTQSLAEIQLSETVLTHHFLAHYHTPQSLEHKKIDRMQNPYVLGQRTGNNLTF